MVTSTTHKTLRGPRGGLILTDDEELGKKLNSALFPGLQGGPLMHVIAAKAVAFGGSACGRTSRATRAGWSRTPRRWPTRCSRAASTWSSGGTDTHLLLVDLRPKRLTGRVAEDSLERAGITCNMNGIPFDPEKPTVTSGIRLGSPAATTRGFGIAEFQETGRLIVEVLRRPGRAAGRQPRRRDRGPRPGRGALRPLPDLRSRRCDLSRFDAGGAAAAELDYLVFISHSSKDRWIARQMAAIIERRAKRYGVRIFLDEVDLEGGDRIPATIKANLHACEEFVVLLSPHSIARQWVLVELGGAWTLDKRIMAITVRSGGGEHS